MKKMTSENEGNEREMKKTPSFQINLKSTQNEKQTKKNLTESLKPLILAMLIEHAINQQVVGHPTVYRQQQKKN